MIFALTKRDLYAGWERILADDRELLAAHTPQWRDAPFVPLSSRAALSAADFRAEGDAEFAERLMAQSGMAELTAILTDSVLERTETVRQRNVILLARTVVTELGAADELALAAAEGDPRLETAWRDASERKRDFAATQRVGRIALADEFGPPQRAPHARVQPASQRSARSLRGGCRVQPPQARGDARRPRRRDSSGARSPR